MKQFNDLFENEVVRADLCRGAIQDAGDDVFKAENVVLTNKRLIVNRQAFTSYKKLGIDLKDVVSIKAVRTFNPIISILIAVLVFLLIGFLELWPSKENGPLMGLDIFGIVILAFFLKKNLIVISSATKKIPFKQKKKFKKDVTNQFLALCQAAIEAAKQ
jgi:hypothetical protein